MASDFLYYRQNVSVIQVAESLGYTHNPRAGQNPVEYTHPSEDNIVITNPSNPASQVYFTRNQDSNRGDVIEFVRHRLDWFGITYNNPIHGIKKVLDRFVNVPFDLDKATGQNRYPSEAQSGEFSERNYQVIQPKDPADLSYLTHERKITTETLAVFSPYISFVQTTNHQYNYRNTGFAFKVPGEPEVRGYELVNYRFKGFTPGEYKGRVGASWFASLTPEGMKPTHIVVSESAIDAMSFYQLYQHRLHRESTAYVSFGGAMSNQQALNIINQYPDAKIHTAFDNDLSGRLYTIRLAAIKSQIPLTITRQPERGDILFELPNKKFTIPDDQLRLEAFKKLSGLRPLMREHRSQGKDFNQMVQDRFHAQQHAKTPKVQPHWKR